MRERSRRITVAIVALLAVVYVLAAWAFGNSLGKQEITKADPPVGGLSITVVETSMKPDEPYASALLVVDPSRDLVDVQGLLKESVQVALEPSLNAESLTYAAGTIPSARAVSLPLRGRVQNYPFDTYKGEYTVQAYTVSSPTTSGQSAAGPSGGTAAASARGRRLPVSVTTSFRDPGWQLSTDVSKSQIYQVTLAQQISRAGSTIAISLLLLTLMMSLAFLASWVAQAVVGGVIEAQVSVAAWMAGLLFALIPLRTFLPGAPPVGSWIDILVFFWVEVGVMVAMVVAVVALLMRARRIADAEMRAEDDEKRATEAEGATVASSTLIGAGSQGVESASAAASEAGSESGPAPDPS